MNRTVFITGVLGGIGSATAVTFDAAGWRVIGIDQRLPTIDPPGVETFIHGDIVVADIVAELARAVGDDGHLNAVVNNAAIQIERSILETRDSEWDAIMAANVRAAFAVTRAAHPYLKLTGGAIVNVASVHSVATSAGLAAYASSKGALVAFTRSASLEFANDGIRVNAVVPGAVDTHMLRKGLGRHAGPAGVKEAKAILAARTPLRRIGRPAEIAQAILFLADNDRSSFITGQSLVADGGALAHLSTE